MAHEACDRFCFFRIYGDRKHISVRRHDTNQAHVRIWELKSITRFALTHSCARPPEMGFTPLYRRGVASIEISLGVRERAQSPFSFGLRRFRGKKFSS